MDLFIFFWIVNLFGCSKSLSTGAAAETGSRGGGSVSPPFAADFQRSPRITRINANGGPGIIVDRGGNYPSRPALGQTLLSGSIRVTRGPLFGFRVETGAGKGRAAEGYAFNLLAAGGSFNWAEAECAPACASSSSTSKIIYLGSSMRGVSSRELAEDCWISTPANSGSGRVIREILKNMFNYDDVITNI